MFWDHRLIKIVAQCKEDQVDEQGPCFFTEEQLARDNEPIVNDLGCTYSKEKMEELVCCGFVAKKVKKSQG